MWNLTQDWLRRNVWNIAIPCLNFLWLYIVLFGPINADRPASRPVRFSLYLFFLILGLTTHSRLLTNLRAAELRVWRSLATRARLATWLWLKHVILPPLLFFCIVLTANAVIRRCHATPGIDPLLALPCSLVAVACGTLIELSPRFLLTWRDWLRTLAALAVAGVLVREAPLRLHHLDAITSCALASGPALVSLSFSRRTELLDRLFERRYDMLDLLPVYSAALGRSLARHVWPFTSPATPARPAGRPGSPHSPRLMFHLRSTLAPLILLTVLCAVAAEGLASEKDFWPLDHTVLEVLPAFAAITCLALPLPALRTQRQWPMSSFRLTLWNASNYVAAGVTIVLALAPFIHLGGACPIQIGAVAFAVIGACVLIGGLRTAIGDQEMQLLLIILALLVTAILIFSILACTRATQTVPAVCVIAIMASLAMALGLALLGSAITTGSETYRPLPPGQRREREEA